MTFFAVLALGFPSRERFLGESDLDLLFERDFGFGNVNIKWEESSMLPMDMARSQSDSPSEVVEPLPLLSKLSALEMELVLEEAPLYSECGEPGCV